MYEIDLPDSCTQSTFQPVASVSANVNPIVLILSVLEFNETVQIVDYELLGCGGIDWNLVGSAVFASPFTYSDT